MSEKEFVEALKNLNIFITSKQLEKLNNYYQLLVEWNEKINLTAITLKEQVYLKHFYDSLTLSKIIDLNQDLSLIDIGTGAGFPGIVLKIVFPKLKITLIDALNKRIEFLKLVIKKLDLKDIEAIHIRSEDYARNNREKYDIATARAVAKLNILMEISIPLIKVGGYFIPMKSNIQEELEQSKQVFSKLDCKVVKQLDFLLPIENSKRSLIIIEKNKITNKKYPRLYSEIKKKSL